jgi:hypothetical protein
MIQCLRESFNNNSCVKFAMLLGVDSRAEFKRKRNNCSQRKLMRHSEIKRKLKFFKLFKFEMLVQLNCVQPILAM